MNEDIIRMARKADPDWDYDRDMVEWLERFAAIVIANNPPQTFMSYQEGYAAGVAAERTRACRIVTGLCISDNNAREICDAIKGRGPEEDNPSF